MIHYTSSPETAPVSRLPSPVSRLLVLPPRFQASMKAFGQWESTGYGLLLYVIDNEIHHRAQGSVYLRALGIEPPSFPDRS